MTSDDNSQSSDSKVPQSTFDFEVAEENLGDRVDTCIAQRIDGLSRSKASELVRAGHVLVNGKKPKASVRLKIADRIHVEWVELKPELPVAEAIDLDILFEDEHLVAVNKPPFMVVHPAKGHWQGTLTAALMHHFQTLSTIGGPQRPGIVHRLDRDTSGVILVAKTDAAHQGLTSQFENRTVKKTYFAIVSPPPDRDRDEIDQPIGVHPYQREKMAIRADHRTSRTAQTFYEVQNRIGKLGIVHAFPKTGRTHQIRVHLAHAGSPVICDKLYSGHSTITAKQLRKHDDDDPIDNPDQVLLERQALHALQIEFSHPIEGSPIQIAAPIAEDIQRVVNELAGQTRKP